MNIEEKEIELIEECLDKFREGKKKYDSTSVTLMISAIILFSTSEPDSTIKLVFLGIELKSIYAVYMLFIFSIVSACNYVLLYVKVVFLFDRYKTLIKDQFGEFPQSILLIDSDEYQIRKLLFTGRWSIINRVYYCLVILPFFLSYFYMTYHLVSFSRESIFESISSFLIIVFGLYFMALLCRAIYLHWTFNKVRKNQADVS